MKMIIIEKLKKYWIYLTAVIVIVAALIIIPLQINEEALAVKEAESAFTKTPLETDNDINGVSIFLPQGYIVESESENNLTVKKGSQRFLIFFNPFEDSGRRLAYQELTADTTNYVVNETFEDGTSFGYLLIEKVKKRYQMTIGIGGFKITTTTKRAKLSSDAKDMMRIVRSMKLLDKADVENSND